VDNQGCTTLVNSAAEDILGWKKAKLTGKNIHDVIHHSHADGSHYHAHQCHIYAAFNDGEIHVVDDEVFWQKNGKPVPLNIPVHLLLIMAG
jgi:PAS domain S-box-containing protein